MQGVHSFTDMRARPIEEPVQGVRWLGAVRARTAEEQVQGVRRVGGARTSGEGRSAFDHFSGARRRRTPRG